MNEVTLRVYYQPPRISQYREPDLYEPNIWELIDESDFNEIRHSLLEDGSVKVNGHVIEREHFASKLIDEYSEKLNDEDCRFINACTAVSTPTLDKFKSEFGGLLWDHLDGLYFNQQINYGDDYETE